MLDVLVIYNIIKDDISWVNYWRDSYELLSLIVAANTVIYDTI